jgi:hypothetical protein
VIGSIDFKRTPPYFAMVAPALMNSLQPDRRRRLTCEVYEQLTTNGDWGRQGPAKYITVSCKCRCCQLHLRNSPGQQHALCRTVYPQSALPTYPASWPQSSGKMHTNTTPCTPGQPPRNRWGKAVPGHCATDALRPTGPIPRHSSQRATAATSEPTPQCDGSHDIPAMTAYCGLTL